MPNSVTLSRLQSLIREGIDRAHPLPYWVTAEISELKVNYSGHCYLELVEKGGENHVPKAKANAVIWRTDYRMIGSYFSAATGGQSLAAGLKVLVRVVVSYHELYGLSLRITDIDPAYTLGDMAQQRRQTIERLQRDGVFDMNRELSLPEAMQRVAVVSSRHAAGYRDFMKELSASPYRFEVTLFDAFMQGAEAENSVVEALEAAADRSDEFDALVLIRGGGSQSDLGCFDSYRLCYFLAQFPLPVLSGIGHDKDLSVADLVAAVPLKTPTAVAVYLKNGAAEFDARLDALSDELCVRCAQRFEEQRARLRECAFRLGQAASEGVHSRSLRLEQIGGRLRALTSQTVRSGDERLASLSVRLRQSVRFGVAGGDARLDNLRTMLRHRCENTLLSRAKALSLLGDLVATHDPHRILERGFALVRSGGKAVSDADSLRRGDRLEIVTARRTIEAEVVKVE